MKLHQLIIIFFFGIGINAKGQTINVTGGDWNPSTPVIVVAGDTYSNNGVLESITSQSTITVSGNGNGNGNGNNPWRITVNKVDINWDNRLIVKVKRIGGSGNPNNNGQGMNGGLVYQVVQNTPSLFFNGNGSWSLINVQYELSGISVAIPAGTYQTEVVYTVSAQ